MNPTRAPAYWPADHLLPIHPDRLKAEEALNDGSLQSLLKEVAIHTAENWFARIACGTYKDDKGDKGDKGTARMFPSRGYGKHIVRFEKDIAERKRTLLLEWIRFPPLLQKKLWYPNDGIYQDAATTQARSEHGWKAFLNCV